MTGARSRFAQFRDEYQGAVLEAIDEVAADAGLTDGSLGRMLDYHIQTGGKRIRAMLPLMVAARLGTEPDKLVPFGAACELIHNATLVHDDLQDGDRMRRGEPAVWSRFGAAEAINLGDAILQLAPLCLEQVDVSPGLRWEVAARMCRRVLRVVEGQQREFELNFDEVTTADYERMVAGKTSGLFALPIVESALLCGADDRLVEGLEAASRPLGILFQIQDDILDLYGDKGRETPGGDLREGKISALVVAFVDRAPDDEIERLRKILEADREATTESDVRWARRRFRDCGALDRAFEQIERLHDQAIDVPALGDDSNLRGLIEELGDIVLEPIADIE